MTNLLIRPDPNDGPIDFETWICLSHEYDTELIDGVMVDRMSAQLPHEWIFAWLLTLLRIYVGEAKIGVVLGSRTAVKINDFNGRLPDILFVRTDNIEILHRDAIYGVPDLVMEIVSANDRPSDLVPLESDYRTLGVKEIIFIDPQKKRIRIVEKSEDGYEITTITAGRLSLRAIPGFWIELDWLFGEERPNEMGVALQLLKESGWKQD